MSRPPRTPAWQFTTTGGSGKGYVFVSEFSAALSLELFSVELFLFPQPERQSTVAPNKATAGTRALTEKMWRRAARIFGFEQGFGGGAGLREPCNRDETPIKAEKTAVRQDVSTALQILWICSNFICILIAETFAFPWQKVENLLLLLANDNLILSVCKRIIWPCKYRRSEFNQGML
jgi:hypothetical protein